jgi:hypothetical protein
VANENYACVHGSIWCGKCRHNTYTFGPHDQNMGHTVMMGRPKYPPRGARASVKKAKRK